MEMKPQNTGQEVEATNSVGGRLLLLSKITPYFVRAVMTSPSASGNACSESALSKMRNEVSFSDAIFLVWYDFGYHGADMEVGSYSI